MLLAAVNHPLLSILTKYAQCISAFDTHCELNFSPKLDEHTRIERSYISLCICPAFCAGPRG